MSDPVRMTKERAAALLWAIDVGITNEVDELKQEFGVRVNPDGTLELMEEDYALLEPGEAEGLRERIEHLTTVRQAQFIFAKRYA
ncbi:hypothetical protein SEA_ROBINROSE_76 [Microbacterium phage RobinRose]|nr:hypothetical protein SEA_ROBINROSE_76 [Microbacterium phage RobinRose]WNN94100.1 hypothetical protein SEA_FREGLEY_75 [Microbacterium phage Fregley]WNT44283.1 hypothetical protein SEA_CANDC_72 [Microbacterium phage CandC]